MASRVFVQLLGRTNHLLRRSLSTLWTWEARLKGVELEGAVEFWGRPIISVAPGSQIRLKQGVTIASSLRATPLGCFQASVLRTMSPEAELVLERKVCISAAVLAAGASIRVGENTLVGAGAMVLDNDFHAPDGEFGWRDESQQNARPIVIGRGVFIGARAIILKGVSIGDRAIVGAGAVVTHDVPAGHIAAGNPARVFPPTVRS